MPEQPLISCIMPTAGRSASVAKAIAMFLGQDYPNKELIIVYDRPGDIPVIQYPAEVITVQSATRTIGGKRNQACAHARGAIIAHWDDDDIYNTSRLSAQAEPLLAGRAHITGFRDFALLHTLSGNCWMALKSRFANLFESEIHGGTLMYVRQVWEQLAQYPPRSLGEDIRFLRDAIAAGASLLPVSGYDQFVYVRHDTNTSGFANKEFSNTSYWIPSAIPQWAQLYAPNKSAVDDDIVVNTAASTYTTSTPNEQPIPYGIPLASCIMPTAGRPYFVQQAIIMFLAQDYPNKELVIVCNHPSDLPAITLPPSVRIVLTHDRAIGAKRNEACAHAQGAIIVHWDDDDLYSSCRITNQVMPILEGHADMTGITNFSFFEEATGIEWKLSPEVFPRMFQPSVAGGSLAYNRIIWDQFVRYRDISAGEDVKFLAASLKAGARLTQVEAGPCYIIMRHASNTWKFKEDNFRRHTSWRPATLPEWARPYVSFYRKISPNVDYKSQKLALNAP